MQENNFKTLFNGARNDLKIAVDDLFNAIEIVYEDVEHLKLKASRPDKVAASLLLDYLGWEEGQSKHNLEKLCGKEIQQYMKWLEYYCSLIALTVTPFNCATVFTSSHIWVASISLFFIFHQH